ncbi:hypothetical protein BD779DRAFT_1477791 [Infundibulicybe gibba]|nr:hypothetical protein BD779DRAFT_1477791 [Infundibulicybe gibba]
MDGGSTDTPNGVRHVASVSNFYLGHPVIGNGMGTSVGIQKVSHTYTHMGCNLSTHRFKISGLVQVFGYTLVGDLIPHQIGTLRGRSDTPKGPYECPKDPTGLPIPILKL